MTRRRNMVFWPLLLAAISVVLAWSVYAELFAPPGKETWSIYEQFRSSTDAAGARALVTAPAPVALPPTPAAVEFSLPAIETFTSVLARPMFSTSRRPSVEAVVVVVTPEPMLDVTLRGVILSREERIALIVPAARSEVVRIKENELFEGWTLVSVESDHVVFRLGVEELIFELSFDAPIPVLPPARSVRPQRRQPRIAP